VQELVRDLLEPLVAEVEAADHQERRDGPRRDRTDEEGRRDEDRLVEEGALEDPPHDRELALGADPRHLLGVQREVVAEDARRLLRGDLREDRDVVEDGRDVVEEGEEAGGGHGAVGGGRRSRQKTLKFRPSVAAQKSPL